MISDDIQSQIEAKREELRALQMQRVRMNAEENRAQARAAMQPATLKEDQDTDDLYAAVFTTSDGMKILAHLETVRPVVADEIKERVTRATLAASQGTGAPGTVSGVAISAKPEAAKASSTDATAIAATAAKSG